MSKIPTQLYIYTINKEFTSNDTLHVERFMGDSLESFETGPDGIRFRFKSSKRVTTFMPWHRVAEIMWVDRDGGA